MYYPKWRLSLPLKIKISFSHSYKIYAHNNCLYQNSTWIKNETLFIKMCCFQIIVQINHSLSVINTNFRTNDIHYSSAIRINNFTWFRKFKFLQVYKISHGKSHLSISMFSNIPWYIFHFGFVFPILVFSIYRNLFCFVSFDSRLVGIHFCKPWSELSTRMEFTFCRLCKIELT